MNVLNIPYNTFLGLKNSEDPDYWLELPESSHMLNHLNTVHASAQFALAEATSGKILAHTFSDISMRVIPVVRRVDVKYKQPATGLLRSKASIPEDAIVKVREELPRKKRLVIPVHVKIVDAEQHVTMTATFDWFIQMMDEG